MDWEQLIEQLDHGELEGADATELRRIALDEEGGLRRLADEPARSRPGSALDSRSGLARRWKWVAMGILFAAGVAAAAVFHERGAWGSKAFVAEVSGGLDYRVGQKFGRETLELGEGQHLQLVFQDGARVDLKGPGEFEIRGDDRMRFDYGLVRVKAGEFGSSAFSIESGDGRTVRGAAGASFDLAMIRGGPTEVHVREGHVELRVGGDRQGVNSGEAAVAGDAGVSSTIYLESRFDGPLDNRQGDSDGDGVSDRTEMALGTDPRLPESVPEMLRYHWDLSGFSDGEDLWSEEGGLLLRGGVRAPGLSYRSGGRSLLTGPGAVLTGTSWKDFECLLSAGSDIFLREGTLYLSFLMQIPEPITGLETAYAGLSFQTGGRAEECFVGDGWYSAGFCLHLQNNPDLPGTMGEVPLGIPLDSETHLVVIKLNFTRKLTEVWIDPPLGLEAAPEVGVFRAQRVPEFDLLGLRSGRQHHRGSYRCVFDELRIGLSWESVLPTTNG